MLACADHTKLVILFVVARMNAEQNLYVHAMAQAPLTPFVLYAFEGQNALLH